MDDTKSTPSEFLALMMLMHYYSASCVQLTDKIIASLPPDVAFPQAFVSKEWQGFRGNSCHCLRRGS